MAAEDRTAADALVLARRLEAAGVPLRSGESADFDREAALLIRAGSRESSVLPLEAMVRLRADGVPLAYLVGTERFLGMEYEVETGIVVPHPATELLALLATRAARQRAAAGATPKVMEVGTGVGVVSVSVLQRCSQAEVHGSELIGACLRLTAQNAREADVEHRLKLYQAFASDDVFAPFSDAGEGGFDVVVANPPYLVEGDEVSEATKKSGVEHFSFSPDNDPNWFLHRVADAPEGILGPDCAVLMECADWYLFDHETVMIDAGWQVESFDREEFVALFGADPAMRRMTPTAHRVMHAWRGAARSLRP